MPINIVIVEDSTLVRKGLASIVDNLPRPGVFCDVAAGRQPPYRVTADVANPKELFAVLASHAPDLLLLDYSLNTESEPDQARHPLHSLDGRGLIRYIRKQYGIPMVVVSMHHSPIIIRGAMEAGAHGYISKAANVDTLGLAIETVIKGGTFIEHRLLRSVLHHDRETPNISPKELEVLRQLGKGSRLTDIAASMSLSIKTVSAHKLRAMEKLGVHNDSDLYRMIGCIAG
ncbi:MAG TPA: response regulator transcription factor [Herbaspirillum sp.]|jgi:DNA-binding NarL/FixJ family response regulator